MAKISENKQVTYTLELSKVEAHIVAALVGNANCMEGPVVSEIQELWNTLYGTVGSPIYAVYKDDVVK